MTWDQILMAVIILAVGVVLASFISRYIKNSCKDVDEHTRAVLSKIVYYILIVITLLLVLAKLGMSFGVVIGALGVFSVAIGFASQSTIGNFISGIFLLIERPFSIGESVKIGANVGKIESIDLISTKIRLADNTLVRVSNDSVFKGEILNLSVPTKRLSLALSLAADQDLDRIKEDLFKMADSIEAILKEPAASLSIVDTGASGSNLTFSVSVNTEDCSSVREELIGQLKGKPEITSIK